MKAGSIPLQKLFYFLIHLSVWPESHRKYKLRMMLTFNYNILSPYTWKLETN